MGLVLPIPESSPQIVIPAQHCSWYKPPFRAVTPREVLNNTSRDPLHCRSKNGRPGEKKTTADCGLEGWRSCSVHLSLGIAGRDGTEAAMLAKILSFSSAAFGPLLQQSPETTASAADPLLPIEHGVVLSQAIAGSKGGHELHRADWGAIIGAIMQRTGAAVPRH
jgi:hypothetical protein